MRQREKVFSEVWIEQASSIFKAMLYSLVLFYPEDSLFVDVPIFRALL